MRLIWRSATVTSRDTAFALRPCAPRTLPNNRNMSFTKIIPYLSTSQGIWGCDQEILTRRSDKVLQSSTMTVLFGNVKAECKRGGSRCSRCNRCFIVHFRGFDNSLHRSPSYHSTSTTADPSNTHINMSSPSTHPTASQHKP